MKISIVTDEISADPETAIELGVEWGIHDFELRGFYTDRVPHLSAYQVERMGDILATHQARIIAISRGCSKPRTRWGNGKLTRWPGWIRACFNAGAA
ncbi:MAG: hypothetical protein HC875_18490 [Anaerolineales bacterium]|nr:hypothetical protein [Anaerolineales bacterium]